MVPALNEADLLPGLLTALAAQTLRPHEVIVADAGSRDDTARLARDAGARVVSGGPPAVGRNLGAAVATGDLIVFLDADVLPGPDFLARVVREFRARRLDAATAAVVPLERTWDLRVVNLLTAGYLHAISRVRPHAVGACIVVRRSFHRRLGGFDERRALAEDHDYVLRASGQGRFGVLVSVRVPTSMRRVLRLGRLRFARVTLASEARWLTGRPVHRLPHGYELGGDARGTGPARPPRASASPTRRGAVRRWRAALARPTTEVQGDAIAVAVLAALASVAAVGRTRRASAFATTAGIVAGSAAAVALRTVRHERPHGRFLSSTVATPPRDLKDGAGRVLARAGVDDVCELHAVRNLRALAKLRGYGRRGRLAARIEIFEGLRLLRADLTDPHYARVSVFVARAGVARALLRLGFTEMPAPTLDLANRVEKWLLALRTGTAAIGDALVVMPRTVWESPAAAQALDDVLAGWRGELAALGGPPPV